MTDYTNPTREEMQDSLFDAIWGVIKRWDLEDERQEGYSGATGNHAAAILRSIRETEVPDHPPESGEPLSKQKTLEALSWMSECAAIQDGYREPEATRAIRHYIENAERQGWVKGWDAHERHMINNGAPEAGSE